MLRYKASIRCSHLQFLESTPFKFQRKQHTWGNFCPLMGRPNQADDESCAGQSRTDHWLQDFKWRKNQDRISVGVDVFVFVGAVLPYAFDVFILNMGKFRVKVAPVLLLLRSNSMITLCMAETSPILPHLVALSLYLCIYIYISIYLFAIMLPKQTAHVASPSEPRKCRLFPGMRDFSDSLPWSTASCLEGGR